MIFTVQRDESVIRVSLMFLKSCVYNDVRTSRDGMLLVIEPDLA